MSSKLGSSSYHRGDTGGAHGDYEASTGHGLGPGLRQMHANALMKSSDSRLGRHLARIQSRGPYRPSEGRNAVRRLADAEHLNRLGNTKSANAIGKSHMKEEKRITRASGWEAWRARRGK